MHYFNKVYFLYIYRMAFHNLTDYYIKVNMKLKVFYYLKYFINWKYFDNKYDGISSYFDRKS